MEAYEALAASKFSGAFWRRGGKRKESLQLRLSLKFEYLHRKSRCEMRIGGDNISNDHYPFCGTCFSMFFYICTLCRLALIGGNLTPQVNGEPQGNWRWNSNSRGVIASSPSFSRPADRATRRACLAQVYRHRLRLSCRIILFLQSNLHYNGHFSTRGSFERAA